MAARKGMLKLDVNELSVQMDGQAVNEMKYIAIDPNDPEATKGFHEGEVVIVTWRDKRRVGAIKGMIELQSDKIVPITRVVVGAHNEGEICSLDIGAPIGDGNNSGVWKSVGYDRKSL